METTVKTLTATQLKTVLKTLKNFTRNNPLPILQDNLLLRENEIIGSNVDVTVIYRLPGFINEFTLANTKALEKAIKAIPEGELEVAGNTLTISHEGKSISLTSNQNTDDFISIPNLSLGKKIGELDTIDTNTVKRSVQFTSNDDLRPSMNGILIGEHIVATDAKYMRKAKSGYSGEEFILPSNVVKFMTEDQYEVIKIDDDKFALSSYSQDIIFKPIDSIYPDWKSVWPEEGDFVTVKTKKLDDIGEWMQDEEGNYLYDKQQIPKTQALLCRKPFIKAITDALPFASKAHNMIILDLENRKITAKDEDQDTLYECKVDLMMQNSIVPEWERIAFNGKLMLTVLKDHDSENVFLRMTKPTRAIEVNGAYIIMPCMIIEICL